jgi:hypothetical protein
MTLPYQFTSGASQGNAFGWRTGEPSIFKTRRSHLDDSKINSAAREAREQIEGRNVGTISINGKVKMPSTDPRPFHVYSKAGKA